MGTLKRELSAALKQLEPTVRLWIAQGSGTVTVAGSGGGGGGGVTDHGSLTGLGDDDHTQYLTTARGDARYLLAGGTFDGPGLLYSGGVLGVGAGNGITVNADDVALTTPGTLTAATSNSAAGSHTHAVTASDSPGAAVSLLRSTGAGGLTLVTMDAGTFTATTKVRTPTIDTASGALALAPNSGVVNLPAGGTLGTTSGDYTLAPAGGTVTVTGTLAATNVTASADFSTSRVAGHLIPKLVDTYDLGSSTLLWRKGWLSELDTILFAENTITLLGGWFYVTPDAGTLAADVTAGATTVDFGKAMTVGAFVVLRSSLAVEYVQVGTLVSGTTYNVTRNLDGSGANAWVMGAPFAVLGTSGQGRIELNAYDTPRIQILNQGAAYNAQTEMIRLGDLNGNWGYVSATTGLAVGEYASGKANLVYDPTNGLRLRVHATDVITLDNAGNSYFSGVMTIGTSGEIRQGTGTLGSNYTGLRIWRDTNVGRIGGYNANTLQWYGSTDGRLYGGTGKTWIDVNGLSVEVNAASSFSSTYAVNWYTGVGGTRKAGIGAYTVSSATVLGIEVNGHQLTLDQAGRLSLVNSSGVTSFSSVANSYTNVVNNLGVGLDYDATPSARLHVKGSTPVVRVGSAASGETIALAFHDGDGSRTAQLVYFGAGATGSKFFGLYNDTADYLGMFSDLHRWNSYAGTEYMRLNSTGLGIGGTPGTNERLRVSGSSGGSGQTVVKIDSSHPDNGPRLILQNTHATYGRSYGIRTTSGDGTGTDDTGGYGNFQIVDYTASAVRWTLDSSGNVSQGGALTVGGTLTLDVNNTPSPAVGGILYMDKRDDHPSIPTSTDQVQMYMKGNKVVFAWYETDAPAGARYYAINLETGSTTYGASEP